MLTLSIYTFIKIAQNYLDCSRGIGANAQHMGKIFKQSPLKYFSEVSGNNEQVHASTIGHKSSKKVFVRFQEKYLNVNCILLFDILIKSRSSMKTSYFN